MSLALVSTLHEHSLCDVPAVLRHLADEIEAGKYGAIGCAALVVLGDKLSVFAAGPRSAGPSAYLTLVGGCRQLEQSLLDHGK